MSSIELGAAYECDEMGRHTERRGKIHSQFRELQAKRQLHGVTT